MFPIKTWLAKYQLMEVKYIDAEQIWKETFLKCKDEERFYYIKHIDEYLSYKGKYETISPTIDNILHISRQVWKNNYSKHKNKEGIHYTMIQLNLDIKRVLIIYKII